MAIFDESQTVRSASRRRRRPAGPPDPIALALGAGEESETRPPPASMAGEDEELGEDTAPTLDALLALLQGDEEGDADEPEYRPIDEEGEPWGMDTDPEDAQVLRNLLALRRQGLQQGRYR